MFQRGRGNQQTLPKNSNKLNPPGKFGSPSTCAHCGSKYHWVKDCPDKVGDWRKRTDNAVHFCDTEQEYNNERDDIHIELLQKSEDSMRWFVGETMGCAVIDSGCSKTVAGKQWLNCYLEQLDVANKSDIQFRKSSNVFRFGEGSPVTSQGSVKLPVKIGSKDVTIEADIVNVDIPLLLSKESLKLAGTVLDFNNDSAVMFGEKQTLIATESGHYGFHETE